ncbi:glycine--tRNA ligase [bacterium]|nr:glycine--tRNA ligase [bacterium]|tara:strand:- start:19089 stop:20387 length:1299 start_codon:yes stop_codon:yes gene_type:complete
MSDDNTMEKIVSLAKRRGFIFQGSEIYGGLAGTWDYGPLGVALKNNIKELWWDMFVDRRDDMYGLDTAILMNEKAWEASGHTGAGFTDPLVECEKCKKRFREDHLKDTAKCPECGGVLGNKKDFNLMFETRVGAQGDMKSFLRPETAQGIFVNFKNVVDTMRPKLPFGIAQIGKAFRNEIAPRDFIFRTREFEQMEIEYFIDGQYWEQEFDKWREAVWAWLKALGLSEENIKEYDVPADELAHYSKRTIDFEYNYPGKGHDELLGLAYRTDHDLKSHMEASGEKLVYTPAEGEPFTPHVIEPSFGVDRTVMAVLSEAYTEDKMDGETRVFLKLKPELAPVKVAVFPLLKNRPELLEKAWDIYTELKKTIPQILFDDNGNVGKRYRRQDEIGTPWCVTVDFDTLEDNTVTVRDRDTGEQKRVALIDLVTVIRV